MPHTLYRFFSATGELLYVGISANAYRRAGQHRTRAEWWHEAVTMTMQHGYDNAQSAHKAELEAIREESPRYNVIGVPRTPRRRITAAEKNTRQIRYEEAVQSLRDTDALLQEFITEAEHAAYRALVDPLVSEMWKDTDNHAEYMPIVWGALNELIALAQERRARSGV